MKDVINKANQNTCVESYCYKYLPDGKRHGKEWSPKNPTRTDNKAGSFKINLNTGEWADFATGDKGSDIVSLHAYLNNLTQLKAAESLLNLDTSAKPKRPPKSKDETPDFTMPIPDGVATPTGYDFIWEYRNLDDRLLCYVVRINKSTGKKTFFPLCYTKNGFVQQFPKNLPKPLYGLQKLKKDGTILLVEGEKAADAAQKLLPDYICMAWMGGASNSDKFDKRHLADRDVIFWPDNDDPGQKAAQKVKKHLQDTAKSIRIIDVQNLNLPAKWDLADYNNDFDLHDVLKPPTDFIFINPETFPFQTEKGRPVNTYENVEHLLNFYNIKVKFNELRKEIEADIPTKQFTKANHQKLILAEVTSLCNKNNVPRADVPQWLTMIADSHAYNPIKDYLTTPWDGVCRKQAFFNTIKSSNPQHRDFILERWMRGAVACGLSVNGLAHPGVLTLLGEQGNGKSAWIKKLLPPELNLLLPDYTFNPNNKDDVISCTKYWIAELSEVASTVRRADTDALKSFISRNIDVYRHPYAPADTEAPRKTCFVASVNDHHFLKDDSGSRRWWVIDTLETDYNHNLDMQQVWAQFKHEYEQGLIYHLTRDEIKQINELNETYRPESTIFESIAECFDWKEPSRHLRMTATQVLYECGYKDLKSGYSIKEANRSLQKLTGEKPKKIRGVYKYYLPRKNPSYLKIN